MVANEVSYRRSQLNTSEQQSTARSVNVELRRRNMRDDSEPFEINSRTIKLTNARGKQPQLRQEK